MSDRIARIEAELMGVGGSSPTPEQEVTRLYMRWRGTGEEPPILDTDEELQRWRLMEEYEGAARRVARTVAAKSPDGAA